ncbi:MAG: TraR/DksA family transcriptional regulator [Pseudomonadota bacterium]|nr:TraR/DksA family transcriptional regulator [Pseudomonadota bacterium]
MSHISKTQLEGLGRQLDEREATLQGEVRAANDADTESPAASSTDVGDAVDKGDERFRAGMAHVDKQRDQEELMAIDAARGRIADDSYGECIDCGQPIPLERLKAQPTALRCVACQTRYEKTHPAAPLFSV